MTPHAQARERGDEDEVFSRRGWAEVARTYFFEIVKNHESEACLLWPFVKNGSGYGSLSLGHPSRKFVHREICVLRNGPPPAENYHAAHSCHKRDCVNYRHLRWATPKENAHDKIADGTHTVGIKNPAAKLTDSEVVEILKLKGTATAREIGKRFGVSKGHVHHLHAALKRIEITKGFIHG